jgi:ferredoxin
MVKINKEACIGCALCTSICEKGFKMNEETMKAEVLDPKADCVKQAIDQCPTDAIS